jgi:hypothetical protein
MAADTVRNEFAGRMIQWAKDHGYAARKTARGNVIVCLQNRSVTKSEIEQKLHLRREFLRQRDNGVLILA